MDIQRIGEASRTGSTSFRFRCLKNRYLYDAVEPYISRVGYGFGRVDETSSSTLVAAPFAPFFIPPPFNTPITIPFASSTRTPVDGVIGGGQIGYNAQFNRWVLGIEADIQASDQKRNTSTFTTFGGTNALPFPFSVSSTSVTGTQT